MGAFQWWHIVIIVILAVLLFGGKKLPDAARGLGRAMRILKAETAGLREDDPKAKAEPQHSRAPLEGEVVDKPAASTDKPAASTDKPSDTAR